MFKRLTNCFLVDPALLVIEDCLMDMIYGRGK